MSDGSSGVKDDCGTCAAEGFGVDEEAELDWEGEDEDKLLRRGAELELPDDSTAGCPSIPFGFSLDDVVPGDEVPADDEPPLCLFFSKSGVVASSADLTTSDTLFSAAEAVSSTLVSTGFTVSPLTPKLLSTCSAEGICWLASEMTSLIPSEADSAVDVLLAARRAKRFLADLESGAVSGLGSAMS